MLFVFTRKDNFVHIIITFYVFISKDPNLCLDRHKIVIYFVFIYRVKIIQAFLDMI